MAWHVIETLAPDAATVSFSDGKAVEWGSVSRLGAKLGVDLEQIVTQAREGGADADYEADVRGTPSRVIVRPSVGPDGTVHGVAVWVGLADQEPGPAPLLGPLYIDLETFRVQQTIECFMLSAINADAFNADRDPSLFLRKVVRFDRVPEFVRMAAESGMAPQEPFRDFINVRHDDGHLMYWHGLARHDVDGKKLRALGQDITEFSEPQVHPAALASIDDGTLSRKSGALLIGFPDVEGFDPVINYWMTPPPDALRLDPKIPAGHRIHPDDVAAVWDCQRQLSDSEAASEQRTLPVRICAGEDVVACEMTCTTYPADNVGNTVLVARVRVLDDSELPAGDSPAGDSAATAEPQL